MSAGSLVRGALACLLIIAAGAWFGALLAASSPGAPSLLVYAEPEAAPGARWPVRVVAVWPAESRRARFEGEVRTSTGTFPVERGVAHVTLPDAGEEARVVVTGHADGKPVSAHVSVRFMREQERAPLPRYVPWTAELASGTAKDRAGPPLYPESGSQPATLPGKLLVVGEAEVEVHELAPNAAGIASPDGRALRLDRSGLVWAAPPAVRAGELLNLELRSWRAARLHVDLVVNGRVRDMRVYDVDAGQVSLALKIPEDASPGWYAVHAAGSPLARARGATVIGLIVDASQPLSPAELVGLLSRHPSFTSAQDPLLERLKSAPPSDPLPVRAVLARLRTGDVRPASLAPSPREQADTASAERRARAARYRAPFRLAGGLFAFCSALVAIAAARKSQEWRIQSGAAGDRQLAPVLWGALAFASSLAALWVLDWAIGFMLGGGTA